VDARLIALAAGALVVYATGVVLTARGRPYATGLQTVHKLLALAVLVVVGLMAYRANQVTPLDSQAWTLLAVAGVLWVASIATGGVVSARAEPSAAALWLHRVLPWVAGLVAAYSVMLVAG